jgi:hypothetical protein
LNQNSGKSPEFYDREKSPTIFIIRDNEINQKTNDLTNQKRIGLIDPPSKNLLLNKSKFNSFKIVSFANHEKLLHILHFIDALSSGRADWFGRLY